MELEDYRDVQAVRYDAEGSVERLRGRLGRLARARNRAVCDNRSRAARRRFIDGATVGRQSFSSKSACERPLAHRATSVTR